MNVEVFISDNFRREAKRYLKKFRTLKEELEVFQNALLENPHIGDKITEGVYKVRLASKSKGKGKSGGFRIINYLLESEEDEEGAVQISVILLSIYDKSETSTLSDIHIAHLIETYHREREQDAEKVEPDEKEANEETEHSE